MRFRMWEEGIIKEENDVLLKVREFEGVVTLEIVNEKGNWEWDLGVFYDGKVHLCSCVGEDEYSQGLQLDGRGRILLTEDLR